MKFITGLPLMALLLMFTLITSASAKPLSVEDQLVRGFQASTLKAGITFTVYSNKPLTKAIVSRSLRKVRKGARMATKGKRRMFTKTKIVLQYIYKNELKKPITILVKPRAGRNLPTH